MCEKCANIKQRAEALEAILSTEKFNALYERSLTESHTVQLPVVAGKFMFPILMWLQSSHEAISFSDIVELVSDLIAMRASFEAQCPLAVVVAKDALSTLCHDMNARQIDYMEVHVND